MKVSLAHLTEDGKKMLVFWLNLPLPARTPCCFIRLSGRLGTIPLKVPCVLHHLRERSSASSFVVISLA